jgi:taurine dioxygenase
MRVDATTVGDYERIRVEPLTGTIGAEIGGVDLREVDDEALAELQRAWLDHKVLFFRDQDLTPAQHVAYAARFGELEVHPFTNNLTDQPEIIVLESTPEKFQAAELWHSDVTFRECPPLGSILLGRIVPPYGGDTCWADMELAYELLPDDLKAEIEDRVAIHSFVKAFGRNMNEAERAKAQQDYPDQKHPIVRTHPETGRKALFVNRGFTIDIDGMSRDESRPLRHRLYAQAEIPEVQCRFRWRPNSIAQWDNRCTQHYAVPDHGGFHRRMERVTLIGDRPF